MKGGQALLFTGWCSTSVVWVMLSAVASPQYHARRACHSGELPQLENIVVAVLGHTQPASLQHTEATGYNF